MQTKIRVLSLREKDHAGRPICVCVCLEHFVTGQGATDADALNNLIGIIDGNQQHGSFDDIPAAPEPYHTKFAKSARETNVARSRFLVQMRSA